MTTPISEHFETVAPTEAEAQLARESSRRLATHKLGRRSSVRIRLLDDGEEAEPVAVPASAWTRPISSFKVVVLPEPFGPR